MCYIGYRRTWNITSLPKYLVIVLSNLIRFFTKKSFYHQGFFAVKRRAVFILGAMWWALVRGWRRDCVVGGMETRFQWRKAHNPYAKCEAFHIAPRLFFMFLFLIPFTIRQHCIIYPQEFSTEPKKPTVRLLLWKKVPFCAFYSPYCTKKPIFVQYSTFIAQKITFLSKSLRYSVVALLLVLFHATGGEDGVFCLVDFLHFLCGGVFHLFV